MKALHAEEIGGVVHCFSYSKEMARQFLDMGFYIGIGGVVTFKNAKTLKEVAAYTPLDRIVLETDCPYLSPEPTKFKLCSRSAQSDQRDQQGRTDRSH